MCEKLSPEGDSPDRWSRLTDKLESVEKAPITPNPGVVMIEKCPKCEAGRTKFEGQTSWECGSYQSLIGGSHIRTPQFKLIEGEHCKTRQALTARESELAEAKRRVAELEAGIAKILPDFNCRMFEPYHNLLAALLPTDRITHAKITGRSI